MENSISNNIWIVFPMFHIAKMFIKTNLKHMKKIIYK